jgi:hypothetical protein
MQFKRVIIYGHKPRIRRKFGIFLPNRHTHSYIHEGFYRAFKYLGFDTLWLDDDDDTSILDLDHSLFLTEDQGQRNIPLLKTCTYVLHHTNNEKFLAANARVYNLCNFVSAVTKGESFNFPGSEVERISEVTYFDNSNNALYQPWATNLLPHEISDYSIWSFNDNYRKINYIGNTKHEDLPHRFKKFKDSLRGQEVDFQEFLNLDDVSAQQLVERSRVSIDIRGSWHIDIGYVPCRIWKSLSYGKFIGSNSPILRDVFGAYVHFDPNESTLYDSTLSHYRSISESSVLDAMKWVKSNHTFVNRAASILSVLK